jgi:hypothetical protein
MFPIFPSYASWPPAGAGANGMIARSEPTDPPIAMHEGWHLYAKQLQSADWRSFILIAPASESCRRYHVSWDGKRFSRSSDLKRLARSYPHIATWLRAAPSLPGFAHLFPSILTDQPAADPVRVGPRRPA